MSKQTKSTGSDLTESIMSSISSDEVKMKSKWYFVALSSLLILSTVFAILSLSVILTALYNDIDVARTARVLEFGSPGLAFMLRNASWILLTAAIAMVITSYYLINKFDFSHRLRYQTPIVVLVGVLVAVVVLSVSGLNNPLHEKLRPFQGIRNGIENSYIEGQIKTYEDDTLIIETEEGEFRVKSPISHQKLKERFSETIIEGKEVKLFGEWDEDEFEPRGIVPKDLPLPRRNNHTKPDRQQMNFHPINNEI